MPTLCHTHFALGQMPAHRFDQPPVKTPPAGGHAPVKPIGGLGALHCTQFMVRGDLAVFSFLSVMQMLLTSGRDGLLSVDHPRGGQLWLERGEIIHARAGLLSGDSALQMLASLDGGTFVFEPGISAPERTLHLHRDSALRRLIEESDAWEPLLRTFPDWQRHLRFTVRWTEAQPVTQPQFRCLKLVAQELDIRSVLERSQDAPRTVLDTLRPFVLAGLIEDY